MKKLFLISVLSLFLYNNANSQYRRVLNNKPKALVFGGAGILGLTYVEAVSLSNIDQSLVNDYAGTSSGSLTATGFTLHSIDSLKSIIQAFRFREFKKLKLSKRGIYSNDEGVSRFLEALGVNKDLDFENHFKMTQKNLYITATLRIYSAKKKYKDSMFVFSRFNTPHIKLHDAIKASTAIEYYFQPLYFKDSTFKEITKEKTRYMLLDGNIANNYPFEYLLEKGIPKSGILGFYVKTTHIFSRIKGLLAFIADIKGLKTDRLMDNKISRYDFYMNTIFISSSGEMVTIHEMNQKAKQRFEKLAQNGVYQFFLEDILNQLPSNTDN